MISFENYKNSFYAALALHFFLALLLLVESSTTRPVLVASPTSTAAIEAVAKEQQAIKAVSVNSEEVMNTVNHLKEERLMKQQAEERRQKNLKDQAESARRQRIAEQQRVEKLKAEAMKLAIAQEKKVLEEKRHLEALVKEKKEQEKQLALMKNQEAQLKKQQEAQKIADLKKKKSDEELRIKQANAAKAKEDLVKKQQAEAREAKATAEHNALVAGEVDKYKALIIGAISRQWILPENVHSGLSSQFLLRLAPNGTVLEVSLTRSSGDPILDRSAQSAIYKASPLPVPADPATFNLFREISLTVRPENVRG